MSETTAETAAPEAATALPDEQTETSAVGSEPSEDVKAAREAAKYRRQLRETETARDAAIGERDAARRELVDHVASSLGIRPAAVWASGVTIDKLLDDAGRVDVGKVKAACQEAVSLLGLSRTPRPDLSAGQGGSPVGTGFAEAFAPRRNR